ncbi:MAG TPA: hypothetical protein VGP94_16405 [Tepidisphaeraceae bacterium]|nr:hypothetical protein [Tepidisphaeraceae bacterium]
MSQCTRLCLFACALTMLIAGLAMGQAQTPTNNPLPPPVDRTGSTEAKKKVQTAETEVNRAKAALADVVAKLRMDFEAGQDWQNAQTAQKQAQADYDAARKPVVEAVKKKPNYQNAEREKAAAEKELADLRAKNVIGEAILKAVNRQADATTEMMKLENEAMNAEPKVVEARKKLAEANAAVVMLKKQFDSSLSADTSWQEAKKGMDMAQEQVATAQKELKEALAREKDADKARQEQIRQTRRGY